MAEPTDINKDKFELDTYSGTWVDIGEKLLTKDKNNHYLIFGGSGTSNYSKDILKIMSDVDEIRKINGKEFADLITKILNIVVL